MTLVLLCGSTAAQNPAKLPGSFSFGVVADVQYADKDPAGARHYRTSASRLKACVDELNKLDLAFVIQLGDFIDDGKESFDAVLPHWSRLTAPRYNVIGNHDLPVARKFVLRKLDLKRAYYDFAAGRGWRFVILDGMDISLYGYPRGHPKRTQATRMLGALEKKKRKNAQRWNGGIGADQLTWLERTLAGSAARDERVILCCHFPILAAASSDFHLLWNHEAVLKVIARHPCVVAWFNGHDHAGGYARHDGVHHVTFAGMVEAPSQNAYAVVSTSPGALALRGFGKQKTRRLSLDKRQ